MGSEATTQKFQRRTVLVKRHLQLKYALVVFAAVAFTAVIVGGDLYWAMARFVKDTDPSLMPLLADSMKADVAKILIFLGIMGIVTLFVSHRWAGPIYRFERSAEIVSGGDLTHRVSLRTGDDLMELQDEFNAMISSLQRIVQKDRTLVDRLLARFDEAVKRLPASASPKDLEQLKEELLGLKEELRHVTSAFKV